MRVTEQKTTILDKSILSKINTNAALLPINYEKKPNIVFEYIVEGEYSNSLSPIIHSLSMKQTAHIGIILPLRMHNEFYLRAYGLKGSTHKY